MASREVADALLELGLAELEHRQEAGDRLAGGSEGQTVGHGVDRVRDRVIVIQLVEHGVVRDDPGAGCPGDLAGIRLLITEQNAQQSALAAAVRADDGDAVAAAQLELQATEQRAISVGLRQALDPGEHVFDVQAAIDFSDDLVDGPRRARFLDAAQLLVEAAARRLGCLTSVGDALGLEGEKLRLVHELRLERLEPKLLLDDVLAEVAGVLVQVEVLELDDAGDHGVEKTPVVRDDDRGTLEGAKPGLEPLDPGDVEKVGGLVEKQHLRVFENDLGEGGAVAPSTREVVDRYRAVLSGEAEGREGSVDAALVIPTIEVLHLLEELGLPVDERVEIAAGRDRGVDAG